MNNNNVCNNCGKQGHLYHQCKLAIISYGIITYRINNGLYEYLMIRRKHSFGFIDFIRGKYSLHNIEQIQELINEMTLCEKKMLCTNAFGELWLYMWDGCNIHNQYKYEENSSQKKFDQLKNGINIENNQIMLQTLIDNSPSNWDEPEWEFPKGRRNYQEKELECALREFEEETGIKKTELSLILNMLPFEEIFIGSNYKSYKHKFYLAHMNTNHIDLNNYQKTEVSKIEWKNINECLKSIRLNNLEKKQLILNINNTLQEFRIC